MPGLPGDYGIEYPVGRVPGLERRHLDLEPVLSRPCGHPRVDLDSEHPAADRLELPGRYAGPDAYVEDVGPWDFGDDPLHHGVGVAGPGPVVACGVRAERLRYVSGSMGWFEFGEACSLRR